MALMRVNVHFPSTPFLTTSSHQLALTLVRFFSHPSSACSFNPGLVDVTYAWTGGAKFVDVCKLTDVFEGE